MERLKRQKLAYLENGTRLFYKTKKFLTCSTDVRNLAEIFLIFLVTFISLFSLIGYLVSLTLTKNDITINNEDKKNFE